MPLLKDGKSIEDTWIAVADGEPVPADRPALLPLERWKAERDSLRGHNGPLGVKLASHEKVEDLAGDLDRLTLIALDFPKFQDGRAYSSARILREQMGYKGELRAVGNVLADQFLFMHRCGFDSYDVADPTKAAIWDRVMAQFSVFYQPTGDGRRTILQQRHGVR